MENINNPQYKTVRFKWESGYIKDIPIMGYIKGLRDSKSRRPNSVSLLPRGDKIPLEVTHRTDCCREWFYRDLPNAMEAGCHKNIAFTLNDLIKDSNGIG